jgi:hypothetical protein
VASSSLDRFQRRLALSAYLRHRFGVRDIRDPHSVRAFYNMLREQPEGYNAEGRSYVANVLEGLVLSDSGCAHDGTLPGPCHL